jgi:NAD(P)-dependent dehydrogenase (short-subunit alcohol dehydrogenase family)
MGKQTPEEGAGVEYVDLSGDTYVVTGSTSGIGKETALSLGRLGAHVVVHGRDEKRGKEVVNSIQRTEDGSAELRTADLSEVERVRGFAEEVRGSVDSLDGLVNNAGGWFSEGRLTPDGVEYTFAVNHLAPFVLTAELIDLLEGSDGDVITTSSSAHRSGGHSFDVDSVTSVDGYSGFSAYCRSKLANVIFTRELDRRLRLADSSVKANCFHPGAVPGTGFSRGTPLPFRIAAKAASALPEPVVSALFSTPTDGAETPVYLIADPKVEASGRYLKACRTTDPTEEARDNGKSNRLWETSEDLSGVSYGLTG